MSVGYANGIRVMSMTHTGEPGFMLYIPIEVNKYIYFTYIFTHTDTVWSFIPRPLSPSMRSMSTTRSCPWARSTACVTPATTPWGASASRSSSPSGVRTWTPSPRPWNAAASSESSSTRWDSLLTARSPPSYHSHRGYSLFHTILQ